MTGAGLLLRSAKSLYCAGVFWICGNLAWHYVPQARWLWDYVLGSGVAWFLIASAGQLAGFAAWNLGMAHQRMLERAHEGSAPAWTPPETAAPAAREERERTWHGVSFITCQGWTAWPCDCEDCGGSSRIDKKGGSVLRCGIDLVVLENPAVLRAIAYFPPMRAGILLDGVRLMPPAVTAVDLGPVTLVTRDVKLTAAEAREFRAGLARACDHDQRHWRNM